MDFFYYWFHRASHEVNAGWAAHIVHHQSEEYNLTVALRQSVFQGALSWVFYLPLAFVGFPPAMFLTVSSLNTLYQFWIHTRRHREAGAARMDLQHAVSPPRAPRPQPEIHRPQPTRARSSCGTGCSGPFQAEEEEPVYGITKPLANWNPVWANFHYWAELLDTSRRAAPAPRSAAGLLEAARLAAAEDQGGFEAAPEVDAARYRKYDPAGDAVPKGVYVFVQFRGR